MKKVFYAVYAILCYFIFFLTFLYLIGFVMGMIVPKDINSGQTMSFGWALVIDIGLIALFGLQHSIMARKTFKKVWTKIIPRPIERSTYVLFASASLILMYIFWKPLPDTLWSYTGTLTGNILTVISFVGWGIIFIATFLINHFDLFGLRQVYRFLQGKDQKPITFKTPAFYRVVRHPLYLGFILAFWFAPHLTVGHLLFNAGMTSYILIGIYFEERDLVTYFGEKYRQYRSKVPKIIPFLR